MVRRLVLSLALVSAADAVYVAVTRPLIGVDTFGVGALVMLVTAESLAFIPAFVAASLSETIGRRRVAALAALAAPGLLLLLPPRDVLSALLGGALYSISTATVYNLALAGVVEDSEGAARTYALAGLGMSVGWGLGSALAWPLFYALGPAGLSALLSLMVVSAAILGAEGEGCDDVEALEAVKHPFRALGLLLPATAASSALHTLGMNAYGIELDRALTYLMGDRRSGRLLYGMFRGGLPVLVESLLRLRAPALIERFGTGRLLAASIWLSALMYLLLPLLPPQAVVPAWLAAVAAFAVYDASLYAMASERSEGLGAATAGALNLAASLGNLAVAALEGWLALLAVYALAEVAFAAAATAPLAASSRSTRVALLAECGEPEPCGLEAVELVQRPRAARGRSS